MALTAAGSFGRNPAMPSPHTPHHQAAPCGRRPRLASAKPQAPGILLVASYSPGPGRRSAAGPSQRGNGRAGQSRAERLSFPRPDRLGSVGRSCAGRPRDAASPSTGSAGPERASSRPPHLAARADRPGPAARWVCCRSDRANPFFAGCDGRTPEYNWPIHRRSAAPPGATRRHPLHARPACGLAGPAPRRRPPRRTARPHHAHSLRVKRNVAVCRPVARRGG